ncbi:alpha/beta hydrolase [Paraburkholderia sediminicola]
MPQFLASADVGAHALPPSTLHWEWTGWMGGDNAEGPAPLSSFDVLDAILQTLASREQFASLTEVVIAGHSGGGQVVQRYAVVTRGEAPLVARGIALRYVVANPSSYVYFDAMRPTGSDEFAAFDTMACPSFNRWKYGLEDLPAYASSGEGAASAEEPESRYAHRDVTVLLGGADCDPQHPALDRSCAAQTQGEHRLARGARTGLRALYGVETSGRGGEASHVCDRRRWARREGDFCIGAGAGGVVRQGMNRATAIRPPFKGLCRHEQDPNPRGHDRRCIAQRLAAVQRECRRCA